MTAIPGSTVKGNTPDQMGRSVEHRGLAELGVVRGPGLTRPSGHDVIDDAGERSALLFGLSDPAGGAEDDDRPVVHRVMELRVGEDDAVDEGDRHADGNAGVEGSQEAAGNRAVEHQPVPVPPEDHRDHERLAVAGESDVGDERLVEDPVGRGSVVGAAFGLASEPGAGRGGELGSGHGDHASGCRAASHTNYKDRASG